MGGERHTLGKRGRERDILGTHGGTYSGHTRGERHTDTQGEGKTHGAHKETRVRDL